MYPACSTTEIRSPPLTAAGKLTRAVSVAKLTVAVTPSSLLSFFSILAAHEAQVIPPIASSVLRIAPVTALTPRHCLSCASACTRIVRQEKIFRPNGGPGQDRTRRAIASDASRTFAVAVSPPSAAAWVTQWAR